jgi:hypothetical protein
MALYCSFHKLDGMVNVLASTCNHEECNTLPTFNVKGQKRGLYCSIHKLDQMVNVVSPRCKHEGCDTLPAFNTDGQKNGLYCAIHKLDGMVDVKSPRCDHGGCDTIPVFNIEGQKRGLYCSIHKQCGMVNVRYSSCAESDCKKQATHNIEGQPATYCKTHKLSGMVDVKNRLCQEIGCQKQPCYNIEGDRAIFCNIHKTGMMINVITKRCKTHLCETQVCTDKFEGLCLRCYVYTYPDKPVSKNYKTKERATVDTVLEKFPDITWTCDKKVQDGCSLRRPDIQGDFGSHIVIIEIDENKHTNYDCSCENKRIMQISQDVNHRPIIFIRFNPDGYTDINDKNITSCWCVNKLGIMTIKKTKKIEWGERIRSLHEQIQYWIDNIPEKLIETVQLFY